MKVFIPNKSIKDINDIFVNFISTHTGNKYLHYMENLRRYKTTYILKKGTPKSFIWKVLPKEVR